VGDGGRRSCGGGGGGAGVIIWLLSLRFKLALGLSFKTWLIWC